VPREHLANALSLNTIMFQVAAVVGPALGGIVIGQLGVAWAYALNAASFLVVIAALLMMKGVGGGRSEAGGRVEKTEFSLHAALEGLRFVFRAPLIRSSMLLDFFATFFASARTMLPVVANELLHSGVSGFAILSTAQSVGAVIAGVILSLGKDIRRQGVVLLISVGIYGLATALFGFSAEFLLSYLLLAATGAGDTVSTVIRSTLRQLITPDHLRGRMTGVNMIFFNGGPQLGELEAGLVAALWGVTVSIVSGGVATVLLTLLIAWQYPSLRNYMGEAAEPARV
jgi:MFS family permease